jgi:hypothetical protein
LNAGRVIRFPGTLAGPYRHSLQQRPGAIGLIVEAKSLARMKQMDEKPFAEYVLIGTFLSVLSAILIGRWVRAMLG